MSVFEHIKSVFEQFDYRYFRVVDCSNTKVVLRCDDYARWAYGYPWVAKARSANGCIKAHINAKDRRIILNF